MRKQWILLLLLPVLLSGCCPQNRVTQAPHKESDPAAELKQQWGIEVCGVTLSAEGYMLDFRYRVVDPERARPLLAKGAECCLIDQKTGSRLIVPAPPKVGSLRNSTMEPVKDKIYYVMFANPGRLISQNDRITVAISDLEIRDLVVQ